MGEPVREEDDDLQIPIPRAADPDVALRAIQEQKQPEPQLSVDDPKAREKFSFNIDFEAADGTHYKGTFENRILAPQDMLDRGLYMTVLANGVPFSLMDAETVAMFEAIAHLKLSLVKAPEWWKLGSKGINNRTLFHMIYGEVMAHEATFLGPRVAADEGAEGSED